MDTKVVRVENGIAFNRTGHQIVSCAICRVNTTDVAKKRCELCLALERRIQADPTYARLIFLAFKTKMEAPLREERILKSLGKG